jgi:hypothetical protein
MGFAVGEFDFSHLQRNKNWVFQFHPSRVLADAGN